MEDSDAAEKLVEIWRGPVVESRHRGIVSVCGPDGKQMAALGDTNTVTFLRSSAKPFQAMPLVLSGAADHFGFDDRELALVCGSHCGERMHVELAQSMLDKIGLSPSALKCGVHDPFSREVLEELKRTGQPPNVLQNNCSGKHAGMLAVAIYTGAPIETYNKPENPVQKWIRTIIERFIMQLPTQLAIATDGCNVPVFGVSVKAMAVMYARLVSPPSWFAEDLRLACARIVSAMTSYPELVGGSVARLDTDLMRTAEGTVVSKIGAEGVYTSGVLPSEIWPNGIGLAFKIEDGDNLRARPATAIEALSQLGVLSSDMKAALSNYRNQEIKNLTGEIVGEVRPTFKLQ